MAFCIPTLYTYIPCLYFTFEDTSDVEFVANAVDTGKISSCR